MQDSYKSILEAFIHAGAANETKVNVISIHSEHINAKTAEKQLKNIDGILVARDLANVELKVKLKRCVMLVKIIYRFLEFV